MEKKRFIRAIDRKHFIQAIEFVIELDEKENALTEALKEYGGDTDFMSFATDHQVRIVQWLEEVMGDSRRDPLISWWLWDAPDKGRGEKEWRIVVAEDGKKYDIKTAGDLYDFLVKYQPRDNEKETDDGAIHTDFKDFADFMQRGGRKF